MPRHTALVGLVAATTLAAATLGALPALAEPPYPALRADRIEDRIDRRESFRDRRVDHGPLDVAEDRLDTLEGRVDRAQNRWLRRWWWQEQDGAATPES